MRDFGKSFRKDFALKMFGLLVCLVLGCAVPRPASAAMQQANVDGSGLEICGIDGKMYTPNSFSEDIVILFFGRTGCPNTRNMIAQGKSLMNNYSLDKSLKLILMDVDKVDEGMESFAAANPELLIAHCDGGYSSLMFSMLSQTMGEYISSVTLPATFIMRKDRWIVFASTGYDAGGLVDAVLSLTSDAHKHDYETETVIASTCISAGKQVDRCRICGIEKPGSQKELPLADHTSGKEATCTEPQTCTVCGEVITPATGHSAWPWSRATCTEPLTCKICGEVMEPATGHIAGAEATCTEPQKCTACGEVITPATGHNAGEAATCTKPQTCIACGAVLSVSLGHNYVDTVVAPTATELGYTLHVCSRCQDSYKDSYVERTGDSVKPGKQPSGTADSDSFGTSKPAAEGSSKPATEKPSKPSAEGTSTQQGTTDSGSSGRETNLKKPSLRSAKRKSGTKAVVKWKKVSGADGYELQMSTKSKKGFKRIAKLSAKKTSYTKKSLSKKKTYYFRIRAYKKVNGRYYYSAWSNVKKLK